MEKRKKRESGDAGVMAAPGSYDASKRVVGNTHRVAYSLSKRLYLGIVRMHMQHCDEIKCLLKLLRDRDCVTCFNRRPD